MTTLQDSIRPSPQSRAQSREWRAIVILVLLIPVLWSPPFLFRFFAFQPFSIPSGSMTPTLVVGDHVFAGKYAYGYGRYSFPWSPSFVSGRIFAAAPAPGDIAIFRSPKDTASDYVKRVVGLPGDRIQMKQGQLFINGRGVDRVRLADAPGARACGAEPGVRVKHWRETLPNSVAYETYDCIDNGFYDNTAVYTVPEGHLFVLGDNRDNSTDSRAMSAMGFVPMDNLVGRVSRVFWSVDERGELRPDRVWLPVR
jgi:signal peptidase I